MEVDPNHQNILISLRSDDPSNLITDDDRIDTSISFSFNRNLDIPENHVLGITVLTAEIPHSWYTWDAEVIMAVTLTDTLGNIYYSKYTFPAQNWSPCLIRGSFVAQRLTKTTREKDFNMSFDVNTLKWTSIYLDTTGGTPGVAEQFVVEWGLEFNATNTLVTGLQLSDAKSIWRCFGVPPITTAVTLPTWGAISTGYISPIVSDFLRYHTISITSRILNTNSIDTNDSDVGDQHVMSKISTNAPFGSMILFRGSNLDGALYRQQRFNRVDLALQDHDGSQINLQGARFNIQLLCRYVRRMAESTNNWSGLPPIPQRPPELTAPPEIRKPVNEDDEAKRMRTLRNRIVQRVRRHIFR